MLRLESRLHQTQSNWNPEFDLWKFVASVFVVIYHSFSVFGENVLCRHGYLAVDLFFVLTGYLFAQSVIRDERPFQLETIGPETWQFLARKAKPILPYYIAGFLLQWLLRGRMAVDRATVVNAVSDFFFLREHGWTIRPIQGINWYLAGMFSSLFVLYPVFRRSRRFFVCWLAPFIATTLIGWLLARYGTVAPGVYERTPLCSCGLIHSAGDICLGVAAWGAADFLQRKTAPAHWKAILGWVSSLLPFVAFSMVSRADADQIIPLILILFFASAALSGSGGSSFRKHLPVPVCRQLGRFSMVLFLTHTPVRTALRLAAHHSSRLHGLFSARDTASVACTLAIYLTASALLALLCMVSATVGSASGTQHSEPIYRQGDKPRF